MTIDTMIQYLEQTEEKHKDDFVGTGELCISEMCRDVRLKLQSINQTRKLVIATCKELSNVSEEYRDALTEIVHILQEGEEE